MLVGQGLPQLGPHADAVAVRGFAERAEELGFGHLFVQQHLFYPHEVVSGYSARPGLAVPEAYRSVLQPMELLAVVAGWTSKILLGTSILVAGYHRPVDLASASRLWTCSPGGAPSSASASAGRMRSMRSTTSIREHVVVGPMSSSMR